jgi:hypothetical protein
MESITAIILKDYTASNYLEISCYQGCIVSVIESNPYDEWFKIVYEKKEGKNPLSLIK